MANFWDSEVWGLLNLAAVLLLSLLVSNGLKRTVKALQASLIPTSVLAGILLLIVSAVWRAVTGKALFDTAFFGGDGMNRLEVLTYHMLALGFIASTFRTGKSPSGKKRRAEIFDTGVTTVSSYLMQGIAGLAITMAVAAAVPAFFASAGILLPFGYGQGTGQALNYGSIYEAEYGFVGGRSFGLSIAALGFLSASIGGVIYLNILKRRGQFTRTEETTAALEAGQIQSGDEIPMNGALDKLTVQLAIVVGTYFLTYLILWGLGSLAQGLRSVIYGFNFLFGVLSAVLVKAFMNLLKKHGIAHREYRNPFLMTRISNTCFDIMVVAGMAAIRLELVAGWWWILLILGAAGLVLTFFYNRFVARKLFPDYEDEQFLVMFGMLTGTASTGIMLLREKDPEFLTPASDNLVYQNFPAIVFGFPMMLLATLAPKQPGLTLIILIGFFAVMNVILFRRQIFRKGNR